MTKQARSPRSPLSGKQLLLALIVIVLATAVVPPAAAWGLTRYRVNQTRTRAAQAAVRLRTDPTRLSLGARGVDVACGPGRLPRIDDTSGLQDEWVRGAVVAPQLFGAGMPTDAWGRCFLMNIGEWPRGGTVWVLSAGPNGLIDTPLGAVALAGDDIGAILR